MAFDRWTLLKLFELACVAACLVFKRVTDDEASRLFLYLQKLSREWSLLNNVTWDRVGAAVADATYGGYLIITAALFIGRLAGELPTHKRVTEFVLLGIGSILFIILGSLEFAALDSVPPDLVDNAAVIGTLSLVTAALFLLDMGGPKAKKPQKNRTVITQTTTSNVTKPKNLETTRTISQQVYDIEKQLERTERKTLESFGDGRNGHAGSKKFGDEGKDQQKKSKGYKPIKEQDAPNRFGIYGKDVIDFGPEDSDGEEEGKVPPKMESQSPVWSNIRKGQYGKVDIVHPSYIYPRTGQLEEERPPSGPGDPGYVQYTAQHWGEPTQKTPRHSPTQV